MVAKEKELDKLSFKKTYNTKAVVRNVINGSPQATVSIDQQVYSKDKSRFFKESWDEEKKRLYFK